MPNTRPLTSSETSQWRKFEHKSKLLLLEIELFGHLRKQCMIARDFAELNGLVFPAMDESISDLQHFEWISTKLRRILEGVDNEVLGLSFPNGPNSDFDIVTDPAMNEDETAYYQLSGVVFVVVGLAIIGSSIAWAMWERSRAKKAIERDESTKSLAETKFCADPHSDICARWRDYKIQRGYTEEQTLADDIYDRIQELGEAIPGGISTGFSWAIPLVAGIALVWIMVDK